MSGHTTCLKYKQFTLLCPGLVWGGYSDVEVEEMFYGKILNEPKKTYKPSKKPEK